MTLDLPAGYRLLLAGGRFGWFWLVAGLVAVVLLAVLYREERRLVTRRIGLFLLSLRLFAALMLISGLFEPIAARTVRETRKGRVIVAVDVSESMATLDAGPDGSLARREAARRLTAEDDSPLRKLALEHDLQAFAFAAETSPATFDAVADL